jgi:hypothetical protein
MSSSGKKNARPEAKFNAKIINEVKSVVCVETFNSISKKDMDSKKQISECYKTYHGAQGIMGQAEQFMKQMSVYANIWEVEHTKNGIRHVIPERLHQQYGKVLVAGDNITESLIRRLYENKPDSRLNGKTIISRARVAIQGAKKMDSLLKEAVKARVLDAPVNGEYGMPSGKSEDDFDTWMLKQMYNWKKLYGPSGGEDDDDDEVVAASASVDSGQSDLGNPKEDENNTSIDSKDDDDEGNEDHITIDPKEIFPDDDDDDSGGDSGEVADPPANYLPKGWVLFKTRGPMSLPIENRMNFFSDEHEPGGKKRNTKDGRNHARTEIANEKSIQRDFAFNDLNSAAGSKDIRGVGADNRKFVASYVQKNAQLSLQQYEADVLKLNLVSQSKGKQRDANLAIANLLKDMGDKDRALASINDAKYEMSQINDIDAQMMELKNNNITAEGLAKEADADNAAGEKGNEEKSDN